MVPICERAAREGRRVYLLGGDPKAAEAAEEKLLREIPGLTIAGRSSPWVSLEPTPEELAPIRTELVAARPDFVLVAFQHGFPFHGLGFGFKRSLPVH